MKIVLLTEAYLPIKNGVVHSVELLANELSLLGHQVKIISPNPHSVHHHDRRAFHVPAIPLPGRSGYQISFPQYSSAQHIIESADIVHAHHPFILGSWGQKLARAQKIPFVFTNHTQYLTYTHYVPYLGGIIKRPLDYYLRRFFNQSTLIIAPAESTVRDLKNYHLKTPIVHVPNGVEVDRFSQGNPQALRQELKIKPQEKVLLYTGRISEEKNIDFLIRTVASIKEKFRLVLVGDGPQLSMMRALVAKLNAQDYIHLIGPRNYNQMPDVYALGDIFVTASESEVHPLVLLEAFNAGLPTVVIRARGTADIVDHGKTGLITRKTQTAFAGAIKKLLRNTYLRQRLAKAALVEGRRYSIKNTTQKMLDAYRLAKRLIAE